MLVGGVRKEGRAKPRGGKGEAEGSGSVVVVGER